jgi:hypothetical protein
VTARFAERFRVYALDLRGHGDSDWPGKYSLQLMYDDVLGVLDELGLDTVTLVGHSMGGAVAYLLAIQHPERVQRLIIEEAAPPFPRNGTLPMRRASSIVSSALLMPPCTTPSAPEETGSAIATMSRPQADRNLGEIISVRSKTDEENPLNPQSDTGRISLSCNNSGQSMTRKNPYLGVTRQLPRFAPSCDNVCAHFGCRRSRYSITATSRAATTSRTTSLATSCAPITAGSSSHRHAVSQDTTTATPVVGQLSLVQLQRPAHGVAPLEPGFIPLCHCIFRSYCLIGLRRKLRTLSTSMLRRSTSSQRYSQGSCQEIGRCRS